MAMLVASDEVRSAFKKKYYGRLSLIKQKRMDGRLALVTTTSALGRSSIYNRLSYKGRDVFRRVGFTAGSGEFHLSNGLYAELAEFAGLYCKPSAKQQSWGSGFRNRREVLRKCLQMLGLPRDLIYHRIKREIFVIPLAHNARDFLLGTHKDIRWYHQPAEDLFEHFKQRWLLGRAERDKRYLNFKSSSYGLWMNERGK